MISTPGAQTGAELHTADYHRLGAGGDRAPRITQEDAFAQVAGHDVIEVNPYLSIELTDDNLTPLAVPRVLEL